MSLLLEGAESQIKMDLKNRRMSTSLKGSETSDLTN